MDICDKNSFLLYTDYFSHIKLLSDEDCGKLFRAVFEYAKSGAEASLPPAAAMAFSFIKAQMERDMAKYEEKVEANRQRAHKRWAKEKGSECHGIFGNAGNADTNIENDTVTETVTDTVTENGTEIETAIEKESNGSGFSESVAGGTKAAVKKDEKHKYADFVELSHNEYKRLESNLGKQGALRCIEILDNYKGASGREYKSDYKAILSWVIRRYRKDEQEKAPLENSPAAKETGGNVFAAYIE